VAEMTIEQKRALALASARLRLQQGQPAPESPAADPQSRSWMDVPGEALSNLGSSAAKFGAGLANVVMHPVDTLGGIGDLTMGALSKSGLLNRATQAPRRNNPHSTVLPPKDIARGEGVVNALTDHYKQAYGSVDALKNTIATDPVAFAGDLSTLLSGGSAALGRVAPSTSAALATAAKYTNPMTPVIAAAEVPLKLAGKATKYGYNALSPKSVAYLAAAEGKGNDIVNALRKPDQIIVPGSYPTAAQAATGVDATRFQAMGADAAKVLPTEYLRRADQQKNAQLTQVANIAKSPEKLASAEAARSATATKNYGAANKVLAEADSALDVLMKRPSMDKVMARAQKLAEERGVPFQIGKTHPGGAVDEFIVGADGVPQISTSIKPPTTVKYPGDSLHAMKQAFDDLINDPKTFGIGKNEAAAIGKTRGEFLKWVEGKNSPYKVARETFAAQSKPINQMQVGRYLEGKLVPALGEESGKLRSVAFANAVEDAPGTIGKAIDGAPRASSLSDVLTPDQVKAVEAVRSELARNARGEQMASAAKAGGPDIAGAVSQSSSMAKIPNVVNRIVTVANDIIRRVQGKMDQKLAIELATEMLDPGLAATALEKAMARQARGDKIGAATTATAKKVKEVARKTAPPIVNNLSVIRDSENNLRD